VPYRNGQAGAAYRTRTCDPRITNYALICQNEFEEGRSRQNWSYLTIAWSLKAPEGAHSYFKTTPY